MKLLRQVTRSRAFWALLFAGLFVLLVAVLTYSLTRSTPQTDPEIAGRFSKGIDDTDNDDTDTVKTKDCELKKLVVGVNQVEGSLNKEEPLKDLQEKLLQAEKLTKRSTHQRDFGAKEEPNTQYEALRRRIGTDAKELWFFFKSEVKKMQKEETDLSPSLATKLTHLLNTAGEHQRAMSNDIEKLTAVDGYANWREKEAAELSDLIQRRLMFLQNPPDCGKAKKIVCNLNKEVCGFGCQLTYVARCLIIAYGTGRTLVLKSKGWNYNWGGWEEVFLPVSDNCTDIAGNARTSWPEGDVLHMSRYSSSPYIPRAIPQDLSARLERIHGDPTAWWIGQFDKYLLRPQESTTKLLQESATKLGFKRPIVGVHVRRTDKLWGEAAFYSLDEYMALVDEYYDQLELKQKVDKRRIYLATDDPEVICEAKQNYSHYEIIGDLGVVKTASLSSRFTLSSLNGLIGDVHFLSRSDFLVCTFSSNLCRLAYELMQTLHPDASDRFRSLDSVYYFPGETAHKHVAVQSHRARDTDEMEVEAGDVIVGDNRFDGYSKGWNLRTKQHALYPSFKVDEVVDKLEFPTYPQVPLKKNERSRH